MEFFAIKEGISNLLCLRIWLICVYGAFGRLKRWLTVETPTADSFFIFHFRLVRFGFGVRINLNISMNIGDISAI